MKKRETSFGIEKVDRIYIFFAYIKVGDKSATEKRRCDADGSNKAKGVSRKKRNSQIISIYNKHQTIVSLYFIFLEGW